MGALRTEGQKGEVMTLTLGGKEYAVGPIPWARARALFTKYRHIQKLVKRAQSGKPEDAAAAVDRCLDMLFHVCPELRSDETDIRSTATMEEIVASFQTLTAATLAALKGLV